VHKRKWMTIIKHRPSCMMDDDRACTPWQSPGLWHFSGLWNLFCRLHNEIILVGPFNSHYRTNSDPTKYKWPVKYNLTLHTPSRALFKENLLLQQCAREEDTTYTIPYQSTKLCPKQKSMAPCAILCTVQFVIPLLLTFVL
jgi:hypothetical protein